MDQEMENQEMKKPQEENKSENKMRIVKLDRVVLNIGGTEDKLDKGFRLLQVLSGKKPVKVKATKRIPSWNVRPGLEVGTKVTIRGKDADELLKKLLPAIDNTLKAKQIQNNFFSFGIHEYIEIPGVEYIREVGIMGLEVTAVFTRNGKSVEKKKIKRGKTKRLVVTPEEIKKFMTEKFKTEILEKIKHGEAEE